MEHVTPTHEDEKVDDHHQDVLDHLHDQRATLPRFLFSNRVLRLPIHLCLPPLAVEPALDGDWKLRLVLDVIDRQDRQLRREVLTRNQRQS